MPVVLFPAAIVAAVFALLFMLAWAQWGTTITNTLSVDIPIIGNVISSAVSQVFNRTYALLVYWFDGLIHPLGELILGPVAAVENGFSATRLALSNLYVASSQIISERLPWLEQTVVGYVDSTAATLNSTIRNYVDTEVFILHGADVALQGAISDAYSQATFYANQLAQEVDADAHDLTNGVLSTLEATAASLAATTAADLAQALNFTSDAYSASVGFTTATAATIEGQLGQAVTDLEAYATQAATTAVGVLVTDTDQAISGALSGLWTDVDSAITDTVGVIGTGDAAIRDALGRIDWSLPTTVAAVASLAGVTSLTLARYLRDCGIPNCQNLSQLGQDLQQLLGLVEDASFLAFLVDLVEHPSDAAGIVQSTFGDAINDTVSGFRSLVGI